MVVMLGFTDQEINKRDPVDWSTNKIGGLPNWVDNVNTKNYPRCNSCSNYLHHLVQVYCPLQNSCYHRTLNIFGCTNKKCWNKHESIIVIRSQKLEEKPVKEKKIIDNDDWGVNDWSNGSNGNDDWGASSREPEYINLQSAISVKEEPMDLKNITSQIDELTVKDSNGCCEDIPHFTGYHVYVQAECNIDPVDSKDYEMQLYQDYINREGEIGCTPSSGSKSKSNHTVCEKYEKTQLKHGDEVFHQFKKRISNHPEQLLRYEWNGKPLLLSSRSQTYPSVSSIPNCSHCQSPRVFELQLMPSIVNCLHENKNVISHETASVPCSSNTEEFMEHNPLDFNGDENVRIEFGCIYIFSCSKACWEGNELRFEFPVLQPDPDVDVLK